MKTFKFGQKNVKGRKDSKRSCNLARDKKRKQMQEVRDFLSALVEGHMGSKKVNPNVVKAFEVKATPLDWSLAEEMVKLYKEEDSQKESSLEAILYLIEDVARG